METIQSFEQLFTHLSSRVHRSRVAVVWAEDSSTQQAVISALQAGFVEAIFVGALSGLRDNAAILDNPHVRMVEAASPDEAARRAVALVRQGEADVLVKGLINTDNLLHAVLDKQQGILPPSKVLTHVTLAHIPTYPKLLFFTDPAVIPYPTQQQRIEQVRYLVNLSHSLGIEQPKISLIHCSEKTNAKFFPFTMEYADIIDMATKGEFGPCIVDGPLDLKTSCSTQALNKKGLQSPVNGEADGLVFPDIEAANAFYKTITLFCQAQTAAVLQGTMAPVVLPSRGDSVASKLNSIALACQIVTF